MTETNGKPNKGFLKRRATIVFLVGLGCLIAAAMIILPILAIVGVFDSDDDNSAGKPTAGQADTSDNDQIVGICKVINDYPLELLQEISTSGSHIRVQYWSDGTPGEKETFLPASAADGGRFNLAQPLKGHVWEFQGCTDQQMRADADASTQRRLLGHADNRGFVDWTCTGLFIPSQGTQPPACNSSATTSVSPNNGGTSYVVAAPAPAPATPASVQQNCDGATDKHNPVLGQAWTPQGEFRVLNFWTNEPGQDQTLRKLMLSPSDQVSLLGGGDSTAWPANCQQAAQDGFNANPNPPTTLDELRGRGLVR
ncbi:MAG: hypothetical protein A2860_02885 [Candidatus Levybacteria bacterium RIFCSPHIGHO2_01_FULL_37_33]|nr:MAG: hypothetical protein A2860_02885 [Candidatus Levybacteria bacterium RIFCSPHIGHO2_01_FULL_37_33]OGH28997.1 MAG: hypothetical protein A3F30_04080 [Candidatus Levybacteria bacterium RIFCSPHIGHO2_12_FULL_37_12]